MRTTPFLFLTVINAHLPLLLRSITLNPWLSQAHSVLLKIKRNRESKIKDNRLEHSQSTGDSLTFSSFLTFAS